MSLTNLGEGSLLVLRVVGRHSRTLTETRVSTLAPLIRLRTPMLMVLLWTALAACASEPWPGMSFRALASGEVPVRTVEPKWTCAGTAFDAVLHGSPGDPPSTWIIHVANGRREEVIWPPGYSAQFNPGLLVFDESGSLVGREGTHVIGGCPQPEGVLIGLPTSTPP